MSEEKARDEKPTEEIEKPTEEKKGKKKKPNNIAIYNQERLKRASQKVQDEKKKSEELLQELLKVYKSRADKETVAVIKDLAIEDQITVLKAKEKNKPPEPNTPSIPTPVGAVKTGLEKYLKIHNPYTGELQWEIPASVLLNPEKNKKLGES